MNQRYSYVEQAWGLMEPGPQHMNFQIVLQQLFQYLEEFMRLVNIKHIGFGTILYGLSITEVTKLSDVKILKI